MSSAGDDRWPTPRGPQNSMPNHQQGQKSCRERNPGGTAWTSSGRFSKDGALSNVLQEQHLPVRGFNAQETREMLKKAYARFPTEANKALNYKASGDQANDTTLGGPWASKPNTMGNGKDFFLELRKQLSALYQCADRPGG